MCFEQKKSADFGIISGKFMHKLSLKGDEAMKVKSFLATMGIGIAVGALGIMMLPRLQTGSTGANARAV